MNQRLKTLAAQHGLNTEKLSAFVQQFGEDMAEQLLAASAQTEKAATMGVAFKGASMSGTPSPQVSAEADRLEAMLDDLPLTGAQRLKAWDVWAARGLPAALGLLAVYKTSYKAAAPADDFDQLGQQFAAACRTRAMSAGADRDQVNAAAQAMIAQMSGQRAPVSTKLTDSGRMSTKGAPLDPIETAIKNPRWDGR